MSLATADLCDEFPDVLVLAPIFRDFGGVSAFHGQVQTLKVFEDNSLVRSALESPGAQRVLVVDGGGSLRCALVGGMLGELGQRNGWAGIVVYGCVRDANELAAHAIGVKALRPHPRKSEKGAHGGHIGRTLEFAGARIAAGDWLYADVDGIVVAPRRLHAE
jgi:regulator of ribonuclease activity A